MATVVRLSSKGQITIPAEARAVLGLGRGDSLNLEIRDGRILLSPVRGLDELAEVVTSWAQASEPVLDVSGYYERHRGTEG